MPLNTTAACSCPPACLRVNFGVALSQLQFSDDSVNSIIKTNQSTTQARYRAAYDASTRVDAGKMNYYIGIVEDLIFSYDELMLILQLDLTNSSTSTLNILYESITAFATLMQADIVEFSNLLSEFEAAYNSRPIFIVNEFMAQLDAFATRMAKISYNSNFQLDAGTIAAVTQFRDEFARFQDMVKQIVTVESLTSWTVDHVGQAHHLSCSGTIIVKFNESLNTLVIELAANKFTLNSTALDEILANASALAGCETQYGTFLSTARSWVNGIHLNSSLAMPAVTLDIPNSALIRIILTSYTTNKISTVKFAYLMTMHVFKATTEITGNISSAMQSAETSFVNTVGAYKTSISDTLTQLLNYLNTLSLYNNYNSHIITFGRSLKILTNPLPQISSSQVRTARINELFTIANSNYRGERDVRVEEGLPRTFRVTASCRRKMSPLTSYVQSKYAWH